MMKNDLGQWLDHASAQQADLVQFGSGLAAIAIKGAEELSELNFLAARRQLELTGKSLGALMQLEQAPVIMEKVSAQAMVDAQSYMRDSADLLVSLHRQAQELVAEHFRQVQASADKVIDKAQELSPQTSEVVGATLRSWVDGAQSAVDQMQQMSTQFSDFAGANKAVLAAWQSARTPGRGRSNGKAVV